MFRAIGTFISEDWYHWLAGLRGFSIDGSHQVAYADEAGPLSLRRANAAVTQGVGADLEAGCDGRQQPREFG